MLQKATTEFAYTTNLTGDFAPLDRFSALEDGIPMKTAHIALIGFGEVGSVFAEAVHKQGAGVSAYDVLIETEDGIATLERCGSDSLNSDYAVYSPRALRLC